MKKFIFPQHDGYGKVFAIVSTISGTFVCPGWHPVPNGTTREQIEFEEDVTITEKKDVTSVPENKSYEVVVDGSKPGRKYTVKLQNGLWSCTCPAATFQRGPCKHVKAEQSKLELV